MGKKYILSAVLGICSGLTVAIPAYSQSIQDCAWRQPVGPCSASIAEDTDSSTYRVSTASSCAKIDVLVDGTVYEHRLPNGGAEVGNIMVFQKEKQHSISVSACTSYRTKSVMISTCRSGTEEALNACLSQAGPQIDACTTKAQEIARDAESEVDPGQAYISCATPIQSAFLACVQSAVESGNACIGGRAFEFSGESGLIVHQNYGE